MPARFQTRMRLVLACVCAWMVVALAGPATASAAMTIDSGPTVRVNPLQVTIWWHSSSTGSSELRWDTTNKGDFASFTNDVSNTTTTLGTLHSRTISNLPAGDYYFQARTVGAAGTATTATRRFTVNEPNGATPLNSTVVNGNVFAIATNGTRTYLGGGFSSVGARVGGGIEIDQASASLLGNGGAPQVEGQVNSTIPDGLGGWIVGGDFTRVGGLARARIVRLLPDGGVDPYFRPGTGADAAVRALATSGTRLYLGGDFTTYDGTGRNRIAAIDLTTGALDAGFNPGTGFDGAINTLAVSGTRLYVGGQFWNYNGTGRNSIAAVDSTTAVLDAGFNVGTGANGAVEALMLSGTRLYLGGQFTTYDGTGRNSIAAVDTTTAALDAGFNPGTGFNGNVYALAVSGTRLYVGGQFATYNGTGRNRIAALDTTTATLDAGFNPGTGASGSVNELAVSGARLFLGGWFGSYNGTSRAYLAAVDTTTATLDAGFNPGTSIYGLAGSLATSGTRLFVGSGSMTYRPARRDNIVALDAATGALDTGFNPGTGTNDIVYSLAISGTRLYLGGKFVTYDGTGRNRIAAVDTTTAALDAGFNPGTGTNNIVRALTISGTRLYLGGDFTTYAGIGRNRIAAVDTTTAALDAGFNPGTGTDNIVAALAVSGTRLYLGGAFSTYAGTGRNRIAAVDTTTAALDAGFNPGTGFNGGVSALAVAGTRLYLGGWFTTYNGTGRNAIAAVDAATATLDAGFVPGVGPNGGTLALVASGPRIYVGGYFSTWNGISRNNIAAVDATTATLDTEFDPGAGANSDVTSLAISGTRLYLGGWFGRFNGVPNQGHAMLAIPSTGLAPDSGALTITTAAQHNVAPYQTTVWWSTSATSSSELVWDTQSRSAWGDYQNSASNTATNLGTVHSRTISNLPQGTYYYRVRSRNAAGEQITSSEYSFRIDPLDAATPLGSTVVDDVYAMVVTPSRVYLGGDFERVGRRLGSSLELDASSAARADPGAPQVAGAVQASVIDGSGVRYIGGDFTRVGGLSRTRVARLLPDGGVDPYFDPGTGFNAVVNTLAVSGTRLYAGGQFTSFNGTGRNRIAAVNASTGALDAGFNPGTGANNWVYALAVSGTRLYAAGDFTSYNGTGRARVVAVDTTTAALDAGFNPGTGFSNSVYALATSGTRLYAGGDFGTYNGTGRMRIAALDTTTAALDAGFNPGTGFGSTVFALAVSGTRLFAGGNFSGYNGGGGSRVVALDLATAVRDMVFDPAASFDGIVYSLAVTGTRVYVGGAFTSYQGTSRNRIASLDATTASLDATFDPGAGFSGAQDGIVFALSVQGNRLLTGGKFSTYDAASRIHLAALDATTGELDTIFNPGTGFSGFGGNAVMALAVSGTRLYAGGQFSDYNGTAINRIVALDTATGALDAGFNPGSGFNGTVSALAVSGTRLYAAGAFTTYNGTGRNRIAAVDTTTGALDAGFNPGTGFNSSVLALAVSGTRLYTGGFFTTYNGTGRNRIAALDTTTGALDAGFNPGTGFNNAVYALATSGTRLYAGGDFTTYNGTGRTRIAALDTTTAALDAGFNPGTGFNNVVTALTASGTRLYAGGGFTVYNGAGHAGITAIDAATAAVDASFSLGTGFDGTVFSLAVSGSRLYTGGYFTTANGVAQSGVAAFDTCARTTFCSDEILRDYVSISVNAPTVTVDPAFAVSSVATSTVTVQSNAMFGYTLTATDASDTAGLSCSVGGCAGQTVPDWTGTGATPTTWAEAGANYGFGATVLSNSRLAKNTKWGTGVTANDFTNNKYAGLKLATSTNLHATTRYYDLAPEDTVLAWRVRIDAAQRAGTYTTTVALTAIANP